MCVLCWVFHQIFCIFTPIFHQISNLTSIFFRWVGGFQPPTSVNLSPQLNGTAVAWNREFPFGWKPVASAKSLDLLQHLHRGSFRRVVEPLPMMVEVDLKLKCLKEMMSLSSWTRLVTRKLKDGPSFFHHFSFLCQFPVSHSSERCTVAAPIIVAVRLS